MCGFVFYACLHAWFCQPLFFSYSKSLVKINKYKCSNVQISKFCNYNYTSKINLSNEYGILPTTDLFEKIIITLPINFYGSKPPPAKQLPFLLSLYFISTLNFQNTTKKIKHIQYSSIARFSYCSLIILFAWFQADLCGSTFAF